MTHYESCKSGPRTAGGLRADYNYFFIMFLIRDAEFVHQVELLEREVSKIQPPRK